ncbi:hypothetical protein U1Q18_010551 [Sarracenia purpurea var. burkii]
MLMPAAIYPLLPMFPPPLHADRAHLLHRRRKFLKKPLLVLRQISNQRLRPCVRKQRLISGQQPQFRLQIPVVCVVEGERRRHIKRRHNVGVSAGVRARHSEGFQKPGIDGGVRPRGAVEVVEPAEKVFAVGESDGVGAGEDNDVAEIKAFGSEEFDQIVNGGIHTRKVGVNLRS